jgi:hypothetical protein
MCVRQALKNAAETFSVVIQNPDDGYVGVRTPPIFVRTVRDLWRSLFHKEKDL